MREQESWTRATGAFAEESGSKAWNTDRFRRRDESGASRDEGGPGPSVVYEWKYLFLVMDFVRGKLEWAWMGSMKSESVARPVRGMRRYTQVWDGAQSHRSELVRIVVGVKAVVQPAQSPGLSPAERVFEEVHRWVGGRV